MRPRHPKYGNIDILFILDSITNRLNVEPYGPKIIAKRFSGHIVVSLLEQSTKTKQRQVKQVYFFFGVNICLSAEFDLKEVSSYADIHSFKQILSRNYDYEQSFSPRVVLQIAVA